jgi:hemerythrin-like domain-containing protein
MNTSPMPRSLRILLDEHRALAAVLQSLTLLLRQQREHGSAPDFAVLRAMLFYIDEFPERLHHPKESELLFPLVRTRSPAARAVLERLDDDHARGEWSIRELQHALLAWEMMGEPRREAFETAARDYTRFYLEHMRAEEDEVLPLAREVLRSEDWAALDAAFTANQDPLAGYAPDERYRPVFLKILMTAPAPIGLGPT